MPDLNDKQRAFAREYVLDHNATQAAIRAGYSKRSAYSQGHDLLKKPEVRALVVEIEENLADELGITKQYLLEAQRQVLERCLEREEELDDDGNVIGYRFNAPGANKALEQLMKHRGMFIDRTEVSHSGEVVYTLDIPTTLNPEES